MTTGRLAFLLFFTVIFLVASRSVNSYESLPQQKASEMALMMRQYHELAKQMRVQILDQKGNSLPKPEKSPLVWKSAEATDMSVKGEAFDAFTDDFAIKLQSLYESNHKQVKETYNLLIASCISCHQQFCPGPIRTIRKLSID